MELEDLTAIFSLFDRNVQKLKTNLKTYQEEAKAARQTLTDSWTHVARADRRIISVHDNLLSSVNEVNEYIIKLNMHINLSRKVRSYVNGERSEELEFLEPNNNNNSNSVNLTNLDGIEVGELDSQSVGSAADLQLVPLLKPPKSPQSQGKSETETKFKPEIPMVPIPARQTPLLPPKGGKQMSTSDTYDQLLKNISSFPTNSTVEATMMHLNMAENCIFVAKWGQESTPLKELLASQMPVAQLHQLPNFGEIFAVLDAQEQIIPRVLINAHTEGYGGYDAYLLDYGEHIHLDGDEVIYALSNEVKALPAEAIRCYVRNRDVAYMRQFLYKNIRIQVLNNNGHDLEVELLDNGYQSSLQKMDLVSNSIREMSIVDDTKSSDNLSQTAIARDSDSGQLKEVNRTVSVSGESTKKLSEADMLMLDDFEHGTSDAVKAVLGFKPTDDQRICRYYDPKLGGCFKGTKCRLLHQPFAPHGATKDVELVDPLPETVFVTPLPTELGTVVRILVTNVYSPIQVYVQFMDESSPLVWTEKDVTDPQRKFKRAPHLLDMVMALYCDNCYYRAQIIEEMDGVFKIFYVDYGNTEFVTIKSLAPCRDSISLKPHRAISCFIEGIRLNSLVPQEQTAESVEFLKSKLLNVEMDVTVVNQVPDGYVIKFLGQYEDVPKQLIKRGYVEPNTGDWKGC